MSSFDNLDMELTWNGSTWKIFYDSKTAAFKLRSYLVPPRTTENASTRTFFEILVNEMNNKLKSGFKPNQIVVDFNTRPTGKDERSLSYTIKAVADKSGDIASAKIVVTDDNRIIAKRGAVWVVSDLNKPEHFEINNQVKRLESLLTKTDEKQYSFNFELDL